MKKNVTLKDVAKLAGVSTAAASKALRGEKDIGPETRARVEKIAESLGYCTNNLAIYLRNGSIKALGVVMPDSFTVLFDAGTKAEQYALLEKADRTLDNILRAIRLNWSNFFRVKKGRGAGVLSKIVNPAFRRGLKTKPFYVTEDCSHCGLCERVCTSGCIRLTAGIPVWTEKRCNMCMACVNRCPQTAIQYGKSTTKRGRYVHPIYQNRKGESE